MGALPRYQSQRYEPQESLDFFPTPPWATRALCEWLKTKAPIQYQSVWEPCCGSGDMARPLSEYFQWVMASDIEDRGFGGLLDFFKATDDLQFDWVITNPPFNKSEDWVLKALGHSKVGVAAFVRLAFLETKGRYERLFSNSQPTYVLPFVERVPIHKGKLTAIGTTAAAYCWMVWMHDTKPYTTLEWIPPCRKQLEKEEDYRHGQHESRDCYPENLQQAERQRGEDV